MDGKGIEKTVPLRGWSMKTKKFLLNISLAIIISAFIFTSIGGGESLINNSDDDVPLWPQGLNMGPPAKNPSLNPDEKYLKIGKNGAVASDLEECSFLGGQILQMHNGNAADAAVTVALCIGLINSFSSGIGGGGFILSSRYNSTDGSNDLLSIDAREQAPRLSYKNMYDGSEGGAPKYNDDFEMLSKQVPSKIGGLSIAVPGELKGLYHLYKSHGSGNVEWKDLLEPVIQLAENGFNATTLLSQMVHLAPNVFKKRYRDWSPYVRNYNEVLKCEASGSKHCYKKVRLIKEGDLIKRPNFSETLRTIANNGSDAIFYDPEGPIVKSLVNAIQMNNGIITEADFAEYELKTGIPVKSSFMGNYQVLAPHTGCSSGIALLSSLNVMNRFYHDAGLRNDFAIGGDLTEYQTQRLVEAMKWMGSARTRLGDAVAVDGEGCDEILEQQSRINHLLSDAWSESVYRNISDHHTLSSWKDYNPEFQPVQDNGTSHFSIIDQYNNSVSMTTSVNLLFGSMVVDPNTGIILNDQMDDFSTEGSNAFDLAPSIYNFIQPFKRPLSSMVPVIVLKTSDDLHENVGTTYGSPDMVIGAAGGSRILTSVFQAIVRKYMYQMPLLETIAYPRLHHQLLPEMLYMENYTGSGFKDQMRAKGHKIEVTESKSVMNGVSRDHDSEEWHAVSDWWRKHGGAWAF